MKLKVLFAIVVFAATVFSTTTARAHCDTLDGPVVRDARAALDKGDITPVLKWVKPSDEATIREAFARAIAVRKAGPEAAALADTWFFETLVRVHRAGEGAPFTGLHAAGAEVEPGIMAADRALESGSSQELVHKLAADLTAGVERRFAEVVERKKHAAHNTEAGRQYVAAYVDFIHYVEALDKLASGGAPHAEAAAKHEH